MALLIDIALAALSYLDPVIGFTLGTFTSAMEDGMSAVILNLMSEMIPGGFIKDIGMAVALEIAATESGAIRAARMIAPHNSVLIRCQNCGTSTSHYLGVNGTILCSSCAGEVIYQKSEHANRLLVYKSNIAVYHGTVKTLTRELASRHVSSKLDTSLSTSIRTDLS